MVRFAGAAPSAGCDNQEGDLTEPCGFLKRGQFQILRLWRQKERDLGSDDFLLVCCGHRIPHNSLLCLGRIVMKVFATFSNEFRAAEQTENTGLKANP
jgi:hypothetical protein